MLTDSVGTEHSASPLPTHQQRLPAKPRLGQPRDSARQQPRGRSRSLLSCYQAVARGCTALQILRSKAGTALQRSPWASSQRTTVVSGSIRPSPQPNIADTDALLSPSPNRIRVPWRSHNANALPKHPTTQADFPRQAPSPAAQGSVPKTPGNRGTHSPLRGRGELGKRCRNRS